MSNVVVTDVVVTAGADHTLREAARRMTKGDVGAAVVIDDQQARPCIITERDICAQSAATRRRTSNGFVSTSPPT